MIDTTKFVSSSLFAGFANLGNASNTVSVPATVLGAFGASITTFSVKNPDVSSFPHAEFNLIGPTTSTGDPHDPNAWKASSSTTADWLDINSLGIEVSCDIEHTTGDTVLMRVILQETGGTGATSVPITVNAKVYFYKYPWE